MKKDGSGAAGVAVGLYDVMTDKLEKPGMVVSLLLVNRKTSTFLLLRGGVSNSTVLCL